MPVQSRQNRAAVPAVPSWLRPETYWPENESVFDDRKTQTVRALMRLLGLDTPEGQVLALMAPLEAPGGAAGGAVGAAKKAYRKLFGKPIKAFHGSPHDFDAFSMEKIGTGEGAQAYGHGLYFAENPTVARSYKDALSPAKAAGLELPEVLSSADPVRDRDMFERYLAKVTDELEQWRASGADKQDWMAGAVANSQRVKQAIEAALASPESLSRGRMYEVNIHATPDQLLDWDKPLSQQSEPVRRVLEAQGLTDPHMLGRDAYNALSKSEGMQGSSLRLSGDGLPLGMEGLPGLKYLDGGSRGAGEGTRNYVIWDDSIIEITRKFGLALPVIEALRQKAAAQGGVIAREDLNEAVGGEVF